MIKSYKLIDIWRQKNKTKTQFTWNRKDKSEATRIDYFIPVNLWELLGGRSPPYNTETNKKKTSINNKNMHQIRDKKSPVMRPNLQPKIYKSPVVA
jgi:hypothetical protein